MLISWKQKFNAKWTLKGKSDMAKYCVTVEIEGPERDLMTDAAPIIKSIDELGGKELSSYIGRSSLEAVVIYVRDLVYRKLESEDRLKRIKIIENDMFSAEL